MRMRIWVARSAPVAIVLALACGSSNDDDHADDGAGGSAGAAASGGKPDDGSGPAGSSNQGGSSGFDGAGGAGDEVFVDPASGSDSASGTRDAPFRSITHASTVARAGTIIWLADGTYDKTTEPGFAGGDGPCGVDSGIRIPSGAALRAQSTGAAKLITEGTFTLCLDGGRIEGVHFERAELGGTAVVAARGELVLKDVTFANLGGMQAALHLTGSANAQLIAAPGAAYTTAPAGRFAVLKDAAELRIEGGQIDLATGVSDQDFGFELTGSSRLELLNVTVRGTGAVRRDGMVVDGTASVSCEDTLFSNLARAALLRGAGAPSVVWKGVTVEESIGAILGSRGAVSIATGTVRGGTYGFRFVEGPIDVLLSNSHISANASGVLFEARGSLNMETTRITGSANAGLTVFYSREPESAPNVRLRQVEVTGNQKRGVAISPLGDFDFGTAADPGGNTFTGNNLDGDPESANLNISAGSATIYAVGNQWDASVQGASAAGRYETTGSAVDVTTGAGPNYRFNGPGATLRLAE